MGRFVSVTTKILRKRVRIEFSNVHNLFKHKSPRAFHCFVLFNQQAARRIGLHADRPK